MKRIAGICFARPRRNFMRFARANGISRAGVPAIGNNFDDNEDIVKSSPAKSDAACLFIRENVILLKLLLFTPPWEKYSASA